MSPRAGLDLPTILQAAVEIADRDGIEEVTLATLAHKLGVRSPSLYNHVHGLGGLRRKLAVHGVEELTRGLTQASIGRSGDDAVRALAAAYLAFVRRHPGLYDATLRAPEADDAELEKAASRLIALVMQVLQSYGLEEEDALHTVRGLRSILHGFASLEQRGGFAMQLDLDETFRRLIDTFLAGLHQMKSNGT